MLLLFVFGIGLLAATVVAVVTWRLLRRGRSVRWVAPLAGVAAGATWVLFALDWVFYSVLENQPSYYPHSDYVQYRRAQDGVAVIAIGLGYTLLAGSLVGIAEALRRRQGLAGWWAVAAALAAMGAIALPLVVPAVLPRAEYGKDPVFYVSDAGNFEFQPYFPKVCFAYGVQRPPTETVGGPDDPEVCLEFRPTPTSRAMVAESTPPDGRPTVYDLQNELNESDLRPLDPVGPEDIDIDGLELERAQWTGTSPPPTAELAGPPSAVEDIGEARERRLERGLLRRDARIKRWILRVARYVRRCEARTRDYRRCVDHATLRRRSGVPVGPVPRSGQLGVSAKGPARFGIEGWYSNSSEFDLVVSRGAPDLRICLVPASGGCPPSGTW